jgi:hypothetical protein
MKRILILAVAMSLLAGCGWSYAAKPFPKAKKTDDVQVYEINAANPVKKSVLTADDPCAVATFTLFLVEEGSRTIKDLQCGTGQTVSQSRKDIDLGEFRAFQAMNVPMGEWYLLVDPTNPEQLHKHVVTNDQLVRLTKRYTLRFHHRMPDSGFMIYTFEGTGPTSAQ